MARRLADDRSAVLAVAFTAILLVSSHAAALDSSVLRAEHFIRGGMEAMSRGDLDRAEGAFLRARASAPELPQPEILLGHLSMLRGDWSRAEDSYGEAIVRYGQLAGRIRAESERRSQAARARAEEMNIQIGKSSSSAAAMGGGSGPARGLPPDARAISLEREAEAMRASPASTGVPAEIFYFLGNARLRGGRYEKAVEAFERAAELSPDTPEVRYQLSVALALVGRVEDARVACESAGELGHPGASQLLAELDALGAEPEEDLLVP